MFAVDVNSNTTITTSFLILRGAVVEWLERLGYGAKIAANREFEDRLRHASDGIKVSHSLLAVGAVGVRVPLYLGHS